MNLLKKFLVALKLGYKILQQYEALEATGLVPKLQIKHVPVTVIDDAAEAFVKKIKEAHDAK